MLTTIFLGTPAIAAPFLERLHQKTKVAAVITAPDQPAGRGYALKAPEVKVAAEALSLSVLQPETLKSPGVADQVRAFGADVGIVVAYGKLLPKEILGIPKHGFLNVHFSLLPKYRGAAPIQWALINGESKTGVTLFWLDEGMDTGPIFLQEKIAIQPEDDAESLRNNLVTAGVQCLERAIALIENGEIRREPQAGEPSKAFLLNKEDGRIDWGKAAEAIWNQMRGMTPWPGVYTSKGLKILKAHPSPLPSPLAEGRGRSEATGEGSQAPGTVIGLVSREGPVVKCGQHSLALLQVQPEGKKPMSAWSWWQGARLKIGDKIG